MKKEEYEALYRLEDTHWWYLGHRSLYARLLDAHCPEAARGRVLDAGCGTGGLTAWLRNRYRPRRLVALDASEAALMRCGERGLEELLCCSVEYLPFPDASFDLVLSLNVIYHREVKDDLAALREMGRVLAPGGYLLLNLPALPFLRGGHDLAVGGARRYTRSRLLEMLEAAELRLIKATYFVFFLLPVIAVRRLLTRGLPEEEAASDLFLPPPPLNRALARLLELEARMASWTGLPLGSSLTALARKV
ncbi:methyltransferase domain-containing protein [Candidatus Solincola sp.]|nr:methyltransferase domain-containing protein [Actinomycetota bacterium]MDI7253152.1 methyltransferase domain-containing protein [Actinomycetota bacterium]